MKSRGGNSIGKVSCNCKRRIPEWDIYRLFATGDCEIPKRDCGKERETGKENEKNKENNGGISSVDDLDRKCGNDGVSSGGSQQM